MSPPRPAARDALADRALLQVLRRVAAPVRHDLAGGMLLPQMQLQMLRQHLKKPGATLDTTIPAIDGILARLQELRNLHAYSTSWLTLTDPAPLGLDEAARNVAGGMNLPFSTKGVTIDCETLSPGMTCPAQPLQLLITTCFYAILDSEIAPGILEVRCASSDDGARLEWQLKSRGAALPAPSEDELPAAQAERLDHAEAQALCWRYGCRFIRRETRWTLQLDGLAKACSGSTREDGQYDKPGTAD